MLVCGASFVTCLPSPERMERLQLWSLAPGTLHSQPSALAARVLKPQCSAGGTRNSLLMLFLFVMIDVIVQVESQVCVVP